VPEAAVCNHSQFFTQFADMPGFSTDVKLWDIVTSKLKTFGCQCRKSGSHSVEKHEPYYV